MRDLLTVMNFTMKDMAKRKSFIISTIIFLIMIIIGFNIPNILKAVKGESTGDKLVIVDENNIFEGTLESLKDMDTGYEIEISKESYEQIKQKIDNEDVESAIIIEKQDEKVKVRYIVKSSTMMTEVPEDIVTSINTIYSNLQIRKLGLTEEQLKSITPDFEFSLEQTEEKEAKGNVFAMMLLSIVLFYAIYFCAYQVSTSITTEKTSKIIETLVTSTDSKTIVLGKTIGIGIVGLIQVILMIVVALVSAKFCMDPEVLNSIFDVSTITPTLFIITLVYFCLGYGLYSLFFALTGATVSKPEDVQSANGPVSFIAVIGFYLAYFSMMNPSSELNKVAGIVPISSPFCMPLRIMMGTATTSEILTSIAVLVVSTILVAMIAIKVYSSTILNTGAKLSLKDAIKMAKENKE